MDRARSLVEFRCATSLWLTRGIDSTDVALNSIGGTGGVITICTAHISKFNGDYSGCRFHVCLEQPQAGFPVVWCFQVVKTAQSRERTGRTLLTVFSQLQWRDEAREVWLSLRPAPTGSPVTR
jgi:hypothetical protein